MIKEKKPSVKNSPFPIHPGEHLADYLADNAMSPAEFDADLAVPAGTTALLLDGCVDITPELALRLSRYMCTSGELWLNLQADYEVKTVACKHGPAIVKQVAPLPGGGGSSYFAWGY